ncbi:hypothetical protein [Mycoplasma sp. OR1901]|uniref:hypothetical protein n=1 Tax=Mycoplasma sp. OR1901 TaxID=2742195 RepID=UPI001582EA5E|nr:hypothetical protein [Mycoplasma sp. OR1901]QKT05440.1 hypothetical protein HTZ87_01850 [Mycoplasma sp. OR1901]
MKKRIKIWLSSLSLFGLLSATTTTVVMVKGYQTNQKEYQKKKKYINNFILNIDNKIEDIKNNDFLGNEFTLLENLKNQMNDTKNVDIDNIDDYITNYKNKYNEVFEKIIYKVHDEINNENTKIDELLKDVELGSDGFDLEFNKEINKLNELKKKYEIAKNNINHEGDGFGEIVNVIGNSKESLLNLVTEIKVKSKEKVSDKIDTSVNWMELIDLSNQDGINGNDLEWESAKGVELPNIYEEVNNAIEKAKKENGDNLTVEQYKEIYSNVKKIISNAQDKIQEIKEEYSSKLSDQAGREETNKYGNSVTLFRKYFAYLYAVPYTGDQYINFLMKTYEKIYGFITAEPNKFKYISDIFKDIDDQNKMEEAEKEFDRIVNQVLEEVWLKKGHYNGSNSRGVEYVWRHMDTFWNDEFGTISAIRTLNAIKDPDTTDKKWSYSERVKYTEKPDADKLFSPLTFALRPIESLIKQFGEDNKHIRVLIKKKDAIVEEIKKFTGNFQTNEKTGKENLKEIHALFEKLTNVYFEAIDAIVPGNDSATFVWGDGMDLYFKNAKHIKIGHFPNFDKLVFGTISTTKKD